MNPIRAVTLSVADVDAAVQRYAACFDYRQVEAGVVTQDQALAWDAPACAGRRQAVLRPASGARADLRLVQVPPLPGYRPLRTHGWAALELCVQDVHAVHRRLQHGPFEIIGPPQANPSLPQIQPMQVQGPDGEIVYLTQIVQGGAGSGLPKARSPVDGPFIVVAGCADLDACAAWLGRHLPLAADSPVSIPYRMLARAFDLPVTQHHRLATLRHAGEICLELDQYPAAATRRPCAAGELPPGIGVVTLRLPGIDRLDLPWLAPPRRRDGAVGEGHHSGTLRGPEGLLIELVEAEP